MALAAGSRLGPYEILGAIGAGGMGEVDARSDILSFGAVLYEMLTGERAFRGETTADTLTAILTKDPEEMSGPGRAIPPGLDVEDYGVTADGQRFLFRLPTEDYRPPELELVLDWTALLGMQGPGEPAP